MNVIRHRRSSSRGDLPCGHRRHDLVSARKFCQTSIHLHTANHKSICPHLSDASHCICTYLRHWDPFRSVGIYCDLSILSHPFSRFCMSRMTTWFGSGPQCPAPFLGGLLQNILWFDHVDSRRADFISQNEAGTLMFR